MRSSYQIHIHNIAHISDCMALFSSSQHIGRGELFYISLTLSGIYENLFRLLSIPIHAHLSHIQLFVHFPSLSLNLQPATSRQNEPPADQSSTIRSNLILSTYLYFFSIIYRLFHSLIRNFAFRPVVRSYICAGNTNKTCTINI